MSAGHSGLSDEGLPRSVRGFRPCLVRAEGSSAEE
jgi:hypothetical protein